MAVDEAPWLTRKMVLLFMAAVFFFCYVADRQQCEHNGRTTLCIGEPTYRCLFSFCDDAVPLVTPPSLSADCRGVGETLLLVDVVEVGPSLTATGVPRLSTTMAGLLERELKDAQPASLNESLTRLPSLLKVLERPSSIFSANFTPRNTTRVVVVNDVVDLAEPDGNAKATSSGTSSWRSQVEKRLPIFYRKDPLALVERFPQLREALESHVKRRGVVGEKAGTIGSINCNMLQIVFYLVVAPGVNLTWTERDANGGSTPLFNGHVRVQQAISHYLSNSYRYLRYVSGVSFIVLPVSYPAHQFAAAGPPEIQQTLELSTAIAISAEMNLSLASQTASTICHSGVEQNREQCILSCSTHEAQSAMAHHSSNTLYEKFSYKSLTSNTLSVAYANCYYAILTGKETSENETTSGVSDLFADCTHLTSTGAERFSKCLLGL